MFDVTYSWGFPGVIAVKTLPANEGDSRDTSLIAGSGRSLGEENGSTPVFLPGKFHGQKSLASYSPQSCKESDTTEHNI